MKSKSNSYQITPVSILELGGWYGSYYKKLEVPWFKGKVMITDSLDGKINGFNPKLKMLKGHILYPEALEEIFRMIKKSEDSIYWH